MISPDASAARPSRLGNALVALLYLALAVWVHRSVLGAPGTVVPMPTAMVGATTSVLYQGDQRLVVATIATNVQKLLRGPRELLGFGFCYPLRAAYTLGEHMFGESLLALPFYVATDDPILSYNAALIVSVWIAALAMYALALYWTRSVPAAFVAGLVFAFNAARLSNPAHPFVHGNLWTPLALLFVHRLFAQQRWRDAAALALVIGLQLLESFYQVLALALIGGVYGLFLLVRYRRVVPALLPKLLAVAAVCAAATWAVFGPYLATRARWGVLQGRPGTLLTFAYDYLPGGGATVGAVALVLAVLGLADRLRGPRRVAGEDPRLILTTAGVLVFWCAVWPVRLPVLKWIVPNPLAVLGEVVPGLDAVRVLGALRFGVYLVVAFLTAYGALLLVERLRTATSCAVAALLALLILGEAFDPTQTLVTRSSALTAYRIYPPVHLVNLVEQLPDGAVLDLPYGFKAAGKLLDMPNYITLAAYHQRPIAGCYNSFPNPLQDQVTSLSERLPDPAAADALYAIGFRTLLIHAERVPPDYLTGLAPLLSDSTRTRFVGKGDQTFRVDLMSPLPVSEALAALAATPDSGATGAERPAAIAAPAAEVEFRFANASSAIFRDPTFAPRSLTARWRDAAGTVVATSGARGLLPIGLAPGDAATATFTVAVPAAAAAGAYQVELTPDGEPDLVLARRAVRLG